MREARGVLRRGTRRSPGGVRRGHRAIRAGAQRRHPSRRGAGQAHFVRLIGAAPGRRKARRKCEALVPAAGTAAYGLQEDNELHPRGGLHRAVDVASAPHGVSRRPPHDVQRGPVWLRRESNRRGAAAGSWRRRAFPCGHILSATGLNRVFPLRRRLLYAHRCHNLRICQHAEVPRGNAPIKREIQALHAAGDQRAAGRTRPQRGIRYCRAD